MLNWIDRLFNEHMLIRRSVVIWAIWLITFVTFEVFEDTTKINSAVVSAMGLIVGILATAIAFYKWTRAKEDRE